jgi:hypothetical protein
MNSAVGSLNVTICSGSPFSASPQTYKSTGQFVPSPKGSEAIENKGDWPVDA